MKLTEQQLAQLREFYLSVLEEERNNPGFGNRVKKLLGKSKELKPHPSSEELASSESQHNPSKKD